MIEKYGDRSCAFIREVETNEIICAVGEGAYFYSLHTDGQEKVYVFGTVTNNPSGWFCDDTVVIYESKDLINWTKREFFTKEGWLMFNTSVTKDFVNWQFSKFNPFMLVHQDDIKLAENPAPEMLDELIERIPYGFYISHSDMDLCEYNGKVIIDYTIGNQQGVWSYNCRAIYHGTLQEMLENFFD